MTRKKSVAAHAPEVEESEESSDVQAEVLDFSVAQIEIIESLISAFMTGKGEAGDLYILKYRRGMAGVQTGFLRATSLENAESVGHAYCDTLAGSRYIQVVRAVLADESIIDKSDAGRELREKLSQA